MNNLGSMPGFTAEACFYKAGRYYRMFATSITSLSDAVAPLLKETDEPIDCDAGEAVCLDLCSSASDLVSIEEFGACVAYCLRAGLFCRFSQ